MGAEGPEAPDRNMAPGVEEDAAAEEATEENTPEEDGQEREDDAPAEEHEEAGSRGRRQPTRGYPQPPAAGGGKGTPQKKGRGTKMDPAKIQKIPEHVHREGLGLPVLTLDRLEAAAASKKRAEPWVGQSGGKPAVKRAIQTIKRIRCPSCGASLPDIRCERGGDLRYYRCKVCADPETGTFTRFKVLVED